MNSTKLYDMFHGRVLKYSREVVDELGLEITDNIILKTSLESLWETAKVIAPENKKFYEELRRRIKKRIMQIGGIEDELAYLLSKAGNREHLIARLPSREMIFAYRRNLGKDQKSAEAGLENSGNLEKETLKLIRELLTNPRADYRSIPGNGKILATRKELAMASGLSYDMVKYFIRTGKIEGVDVNGKKFFPLNEAEKLIKRTRPEGYKLLSDVIRSESERRRIALRLKDESLEGCNIGYESKCVYALPKASLDRFRREIDSQVASELARLTPEKFIKFARENRIELYKTSQKGVYKIDPEEVLDRLHDLALEENDIRDNYFTTKQAATILNLSEVRIGQLIRERKINAKLVRLYKERDKYVILRKDIN